MNYGVGFSSVEEDQPWTFIYSLGLNSPEMDWFLTSSSCMYFEESSSYIIDYVLSQRDNFISACNDVKASIIDQTLSFTSMLVSKGIESEAHADKYANSIFSLIYHSPSLAAVVSITSVLSKPST